MRRKQIITLGGLAVITSIVMALLLSDFGILSVHAQAQQRLEYLAVIKTTIQGNSGDDGVGEVTYTFMVETDAVVSSQLKAIVEGYQNDWSPMRIISAAALEGWEFIPYIPSTHNFGENDSQQIYLLFKRTAGFILLNSGAGTSTPMPIDMPEATPTSTPPTMTLYRIVQDESQVSFTLTDELRGQQETVVGTTNQVAGDIGVDFNNPTASRVGVIRINARTLVTNNEFRNRTIRGQILQSSQAQYEYIDFTPTSIRGLPSNIEIGQQITFQIIGDLKIRDIVQSVTFDVTAEAISSDRLEGNAHSIITRSQFDLTIPSVPGVADVSEEITLEIQFVAEKVN